MAEVLSPNDVITCLWHKNSTEKCRIGLADTILFETGLPSRWYVTGKTGEVLLKRGVDIPAISQRWQKICNQSESKIIAIIRQQGGILKFLTAEAWQLFSENAVADNSILSVHCFVKGLNRTVFRNKFELKDKLGRFVSSTRSYSFQFDPSSPDAVTAMNSEKSSFVESKSTPLKNIMDLATNTVVRYLEMMLSMKILSISIDYVIDTKSQLWMLWTSEAKFVRTTTLKDIEIPGIVDGDKVGRMSWAGQQYLDGVNLAEAVSPTSKSFVDSLSPVAKRSAGDSWTDRNSDSSELSAGDRRAGKNDVTISNVSLQVAAASAVIDEAVTSQGKHKRKANLQPSLQSFTIGSTNNKIRESSFPDPFKCRGDYCKVHLNPVGPLVGDDITRAHVMEKFFSAKEIDVMRKDHRYNKMVEFGADGPALAAVSMKSIIKAREENRGMAIDPNAGKEWKAYPMTSRDNLASLWQKGESDQQQQQASADEEIESMLEKDKEHRYKFTKSVATYYEQVRVCGVCYNIYTLFDWARGVLGKGLDAHGADVMPSIATMPSWPSITGTSLPLLRDSKEIDRFLPEGSGTPSKRRSTTSQSSKGKKIGNRTWKDYLPKGDEKTVEQTPQAPSSSNLRDLDDYLREGATTLAASKVREKELFMKSRVSQLLQGSEYGSEEVKKNETNLYRGRVLLAAADGDAAFQARTILEDANFDVHWVRDGREAANAFCDAMDGNEFDCILVEKKLPLMGFSEVTRFVREEERQHRKAMAAVAASDGKGVQPPSRRHAVICFTNDTSPEDLKSYMKADMDGCISIPVQHASLLNTVRAAIPHHLATLSNKATPVAVEVSKVSKLGSFGELEGSTDSATVAAKSLIVGSSAGQEDCAFNGVVQIDADTRVPFAVLDASRNSKIAHLNTPKPYFNLVVCNDLFDTFERLKIFLQPMAQRYMGLQILLWNYPGQALTEWREEQLLNNEYLATCLNDVLGQVGEKGTKDFDTTRPFFIMGCGNGGNIAAFYAAHFRVPNLRSLLLVNSWAFVDSYLAGLMHDCINVFQCSPPSRPDLPVYFFSRFMFSKDYLAKVSVPLALNIYTAVHNPISLKGRVSLCKGVLKSVDLRPLLREIDCPILCIQSTQDSLARPIQSQAFTQSRGGEVRSIFKAFKEPSKTCVIWMKGGHEVFQENKKQSQIIVEQILTGFHETHDVTFPSAPAVDILSAHQGTFNMDRSESGSSLKTVEDKFIDNVLGNMSKMNMGGPSHPMQKIEGDPPGNSLPSIVNKKHQQSESHHLKQVILGEKSKYLEFSSDDPKVWLEYSQGIVELQLANIKKRETKGKTTNDSSVSILIDPTSTAFEKQNSVVYGPRAKGRDNDVQEYPEVKEYMSWRLKRNKKRLQRLQGAARIVQSAFRAYLARQFVARIRRNKAAVTIQRFYRGCRGRHAFLEQARRIWAGQTIQRVYRGYKARQWYFEMRLRIAAAVNIQRAFRGHRARLFVAEVHRIRHKAASIIQAMFRRTQARNEAWKRRVERNSATTIQRIFRGHMGRRKAKAERDKFIFSRSQSQGIEFGRQMLLEHKLHATRLQSDVTLLGQEKVGAEEQVEALLEEISGFEQGVRTLEKEMHQLAKIESEAAAFMDEESKYELREQKMRLDSEFGEMLAKIGNRKDMLNDLERKLGTIDKARQAKEEELRTLERKLVVLLEEQQNELNAIKRKQDVRGALLAASHDELMKASSAIPGGQSQALTIRTQGLTDGSLVGGGGPSMQEKRQAAQLMQSTETLMKFGFMSMSMTYFSSLNMIKALRTVSAQDTVMAALADVHAQRAVGFGSGNSNPLSSIEGDGSRSKGVHMGALKPGQLPGQEALRVSAWSVEDVSKWLQTISLGQYSEAFIDAAIDGEFLYDINDDDLKNTLGIEHRLHRKKILNCVNRLKIAESQADSRVNALLRGSGSMDNTDMGAPRDPLNDFPSDPFESSDGQPGPGEDRKFVDGPKVQLSELMSLVRHSKLSLIKQALDYLPNKNFDKTLVQAPYVAEHGTVYVEGYERLPFHMNKTDDHGNTMLGLACQNGNVKICKYLVAKGANLNHQNKMGQTPGHFAVAYQFFDLSTWMFENGADDTVENKFGLTPYDGLDPDGGES